MASTTTSAAAIPDNLTRDQYVYLAKLAQQAECYEEMVQFMEKLVVGSTPVSELTVEERNLLSVAYKNVIGSLRAVWRIVSSIEQKEEGRKNEEHVVLFKEYRSQGRHVVRRDVENCGPYNLRRGRAMNTMTSLFFFFFKASINHFKASSFQSLTL